MLSETLAAGLEQYKIGAKVKSLRLKKGLGQVQLGAHTGLSPAMLSKIERGQVVPTLPTLLRIATVFGVGLEHFFVDDSQRPNVAVVRKKDRLRLPDRQDAEIPSYMFESLDFPVTDRKMDAYLAEFPARSDLSEPHQHSGVEFIYVLKGRLVVEIDGQEYELDDGDSMYFDSDTPHRYGHRRRSPCSAIVVVAP